MIFDVAPLAEPLYCSSERIILIRGVHWNLNLRELHDSIYGEPIGGRVLFVITKGALILSRCTALPALRTGPWPAMAVTTSIKNSGRIQGKGGNGGNGGSAYPSGGSVVTEPGGSGGTGGDAWLVEGPMIVDNTNGEIWAGGGGSGGGGAAVNEVFPELFYYGGAGAGGGAGKNPGAASSGGSGFYGSGTGGNAGSATAGGSAGTPAGPAGAASAGGGPGLNGSAGNAGAGNFQNGAGGAAGTRGRYIVGNSLITWIATGDVRGDVA